ncbi:MAG TPA: proline--tRNA ligase [Patescibacteria group bacterium]|jgi:prolyl-tRNA synthetase
MKLTKQSDDFPQWYQDIVKEADLAEPSFARGTMVIKPYGYEIWERIQRHLDDRIKETGHKNLYFPMFIPSKLLDKEASHIEGFSPEVAVVTHAGGNKLEEPLVVRPTSEAIIWGTYAKWVQSYRDLPLLYNQWANVVRWEMRPRLFLRTTEFLWQEGHTAHQTAKEAREETLRMLEVYRETAEQLLGIPVIAGRKSESERFPGADETYTIEALMRDGKALQAGTSHDLGQNFAKAYNVTFLDPDGKETHAYATSWGVSTRIIGGLIMTHGDDQGLRLPPSVAPYQAVIIPIVGDDTQGAVAKEATKLRDQLAEEGIRVFLDDDDQSRPGFKFNKWEARGVPIRIELGPKDLEAKSVTLARRDQDKKTTAKLSEVVKTVTKMLDDVQSSLLKDATAFRDEHTHQPKDYESMAKLLSDQAGLVKTYWCGEEACEQKVKQETKATIRCLTLEPVKNPGKCLVCGKVGKEQSYWAKAY